ncbi:MAG: translation initiation factor IF-2 [Bacteroidales bacterium]|jgi:translation initiation factor IF-2|nr:translation initiation factor IF-2 [Bacteroidales bacterium]
MAGMRISKVLKDFNIGMSTLINFLEKKGKSVEANPNAKLDEETLTLVQKEFLPQQQVKEDAKKIAGSLRISESDKKTYQLEKEEKPKDNFIETAVETPKAPTVVGKIDLDKISGKKEKEKPAEPKKEEAPKPAAEEKAPEKKEEKAPKAPAKKKEEAKKEEVKKEDVKKEEKPVEEKKEEKASETVEPQKKDESPSNFIETKVEQLQGPKDTGQRIDLSKFESPKKKSGGKRERIKKNTKEKVDINKETNQNREAAKKAKDKKGKKGFKPIRNEVDEDEVQKQIKETYQRMVEGKGKTKGSKYRREKREIAEEKREEEIQRRGLESNILKVTEFVTVNDLAVMIDQPVTKVISACMNLGLMVSINQRLDADALTLVAEDFGYKIEFVSAEIQEAIKEETVEDKPEDMEPRAPIVTVMGHVDHGKTSLLDYIRQSNVIAGEAGGITQHIGAYNVKLPNGRRITFLDTPGHEAFTAMRARGAKMTDLAIIIVAADDAVMPQTVEAINHAQAAGVPMIFAINKIDKPGAMPDKIREQLSQMNILVEEWGGKYQCQEISAKKGIGVADLLDKVLLEADMLDLKANPNKKAVGTVIESSLDKGRGYLATLLVQGGTLHTGDIMLSGMYTGKVKAMFNERGQKIKEAGPSVPVSVLGLNGAPQAGDTFNIFDNERDAREIANKREQLLRIQGLRTQKHITLEELGRRIAIGNFKELNIIVKGDVDGSIEALSDSLIKLSTEEVRVNVIHKAVGEISESDVLLAEASEAIIIGFQVRPSMNARKMAEKEEIEIRLYSVIYDAINEVKSGIEGMLAPVEKEVVTSTLEIRQTFKISKVGTIAGCMVKEGKITRTAKVRVIRDGIVIKEGVLASLKRGKDDVKEVAAGYDCGLGIENFNDIKEGDVIEAYKIEEIKRTL